LDKRIYKINKLLTDYSLGRFEGRLELSENLDDIDAFINGVNMLGEELKDTTISRDYFFNILNSVSDMVFVCNKHGKVEEINESGCEQLECIKDAIIGSHLDDLQDQAQQSLWQSIYQNLKSGKESVTLESVLFTHTGKRIPVHIYSCYLTNDQKKKSSILVTAKDMTLQIESENMLLRAIIDTQEKERQRLAQDLHDSLGQQISAIKFYISATADTIEDPNNKEILVKSNEALVRVLADMRNICFNLMPKTLEEFGLLEAIDELCNQPAYAGKISFHIASSPQFPELKQYIEIDIFRVVQEFINNALNHGGATRIWMKFHHFKSHVRILLKDNGKGFHYSEERVFLGRGLQNAQSRIKSHNGELKIKSIPENGTEYQLTIPIIH
jgi:PAS domain S-box-containing protein